jgi:hypothetical protein
VFFEASADVEFEINSLKRVRGGFGNHFINQKNC